MTITTNDGAITNEVTINASLNLVWYAWTISERVSEWFAPETVIEAREGGAYELYFIPGNKCRRQVEFYTFCSFPFYTSAENMLFRFLIR